MDFMGIGPLELLLVLIIGFLLLGPDKLPEIATKAGRLYRDFKKTTSNLGKTISEDFATEKKAIDEDLSSIRKTISEDFATEKKAIDEDLSSIRKTIAEDLSSTSRAQKDSKTASVPASEEKSNVENTQKTTLLPQSDEKPDE